MSACRQRQWSWWNQAVLCLRTSGSDGRFRTEISCPNFLVKRPGTQKVVIQYFCVPIVINNAEKTVYPVVVLRQMLCWSPTALLKYRDMYCLMQIVSLSCCGLNMIYVFHCSTSKMDTRLFQYLYSWVTRICMPYFRSQICPASTYTLEI